jgi:cytochrome c-type biogenesis protein CcmH
MIWLLVIGLAAIAFAFMVVVFRLPRTAWTTALAALALGLAGYAAQGSPGLPGAPKQAAPLEAGEGASLVDLRRAVVPEDQRSTHPGMITADALTRRDRFADAATILLGATRDNPRDGEAWLALGNDLVAAADGAVTPAARLAYRRAETAAPRSPGVPFFIGVQELQAGNFIDARKLWAEAAQRAPEGSEARTTIEDRIARLDAIVKRMLEMQQQQQQQQQPPGAAK